MKAIYFINIDKDRIGTDTAIYSVKITNYIFLGAFVISQSLGLPGFKDPVQSEGWSARTERYTYWR
jgi:hypothetical protein